jgi:hypothetical protein
VPKQAHQAQPPKEATHSKDQQGLLQPSCYVPSPPNISQAPTLTDTQSRNAV